MKPKSITIVGGGATGLAAAHFCARAGRAVTLLEAGPSFGGLLDTFPIAGTRLEHYYHHHFTHDRELREMLAVLGISDRLRFYEGATGIHGKFGIQPFTSPGDLLRFRGLSPVDKARFAWTSLYLGKAADWRTYEDVPAIDWFARHAGRGVVDRVWGPLLRAKFGSHADAIPLSWMIGRLSQRMNSREGATEKLGYLDGSLSVFLDAMLGDLRARGVDFRAGCPVQTVRVRGDAIAALETPQGAVETDEYLFTIPLGPLARVFGDALPGFAADLGRVRYLGALCLILETAEPLSGTYWINVTDPACPFTGVIEHTNLVPPENYGGRRITYLARYFDPRTDAVAQAPRAAVEDLFLGHLARMFPAFDRTRLLGAHFFRTMEAATLCDLGFSARVPPFLGPLANMRLANMAHVYPDERSLNNSIRTARLALAA